MKCSVIIPLGPGHHAYIEDSKQSIREAITQSKGPFDQISTIIINDLEGKIGRSNARNQGIKQAKADQADWIFFLDADDIIMKNVFESFAPYEKDYDAVWGNILIQQPHQRQNNQASHIGQLITIHYIEEILLFEPFITLQIGHFIRTDLALDNLFSSYLDAGEDFEYYLKVWTKYKCIKIKDIFFMNRVGFSSIGPRAATGADWLHATRHILKSYRVKLGINHVNTALIELTNQKVIEYARYIKENHISDPNNFIHLKKLFPYKGYMDVSLKTCPTFVMITHNDDLVLNRLLWIGDYRLTSFLIWSKLAKHAKRIFDIGAYTGIFSLVAALSNLNSQIYCFEPLTRNYARIIENIFLNHVTNIHVYCQCVTHSDEDQHFYIYEDSSDLPLINSTRNHSQTMINSSKIKSISLNTFCKENDCYPDLIAIDTSGAEINVLQGMIDIIPISQPDFIVSLFDQETADFVTQFFQPFHYYFYDYCEDNPYLNQIDVIEAKGDDLKKNIFISTKPIDTLKRILSSSKNQTNLSPIQEE